MSNEPMPLVVQGTSALEPQPISPDQYAEIALVEARKATQAALSAVASAKVVKVETEDDYHAADKAMAAIKADMKRFDTKRDGLVRPFNTAVKTINAEFKKAETAFNEALGCYRPAMTTFQAKLAEERRKAEEAAKFLTDWEEAIAEDTRRTAEKELRKAQEAAEAAAATIAPDDPFAAILAQQEAEEAQQKAAEAAEAFKQTIRDTKPAKVAPVSTPKITGFGSRTYDVWEYEITDPDLVPMEYRPINEALIAADVKRLKGETAIPGVKVKHRTEVR